MKQKLKTIIEELQNASKMHLRQSKELSSHAEDMDKGSPANKKGKYKPEDLLLETDNPSDYNVQNLSDVQVDKKGQYVTTLGDDENIPDVNNDYTRPTSNTNEINGMVTQRDTIRPSKGNVFKSELNKKDLKKKKWIQGYY